MSDKLLKTSEAALLLGTSEKTLAVWRCRGYGPHFIKIGKPDARRSAIRYRQSDISAYIENPIQH
jgi:predicted DNA-binding transcriptional regulator AlpA